MKGSEVANAELVRLLFEDGWNRRSFGFLDGHTPDSIPFHYNGTSMTVPGDSLPGLVDLWRTAFPDLEMEIRHLVAQDDLVAVSLVVHGTHEGEWLGLPASRKRISVEEMMFFRFEDGVLAEMWELFDEHTMRRQIETGGGEAVAQP